MELLWSLGSFLGRLGVLLERDLVVEGCLTSAIWGDEMIFDGFRSLLTGVPIPICDPNALVLLFLDADSDPEKKLLRTLDERANSSRTRRKPSLLFESVMLCTF